MVWPSGGGWIPHLIQTLWDKFLGVLLYAFAPVPWLLAFLSACVGGFVPWTGALGELWVSSWSGTDYSGCESSTTACYSAKWSTFQCRCVERSTDPTLCPLLSRVLIFLQLLVDRNSAPSKVKIYAAAIFFLSYRLCRGIFLCASAVAFQALNVVKRGLNIIIFCHSGHSRAPY